jgi:oligoribonuclease NrnB/cAMP/cGMP phosphodiesterase (DHH superfamily)
MKERLFIYHGGCYDGFTAAWVFNKYFKPGMNDAPVIYHPAHYGEDPPDCKGKEVWLVDFSYKRDVMIEKIIKPSTRTIIMDHHKTAQADLDGILDELREKHRLQRDGDRVVFDMQRSGSGILADELEAEAGKKAGFHKPKIFGRSLWLVDYVEDRDLWNWKLPNSDLFSAYLASVPMTFGSWDAVYDAGLNAAVEGGRAIKRYIDTFGEKIREQARFETIGEYRVPTINTPYMNISDHLNALAEQYPDAPFSAGYFRKRDGDWQFSLRVRKGSDFDCSAVATEFGGGGHRAAAGFEVKTLPWDKPEIIHMGEDSE